MFSPYIYPYFCDAQCQARHALTDSAGILLFVGSYLLSLVRCLGCCAEDLSHKSLTGLKGLLSLWASSGRQSSSLVADVAVNGEIIYHFNILASCRHGAILVYSNVMCIRCIKRVVASSYVTHQR